MLPVQIIDGLGKGLITAVDECNEGKHALVVATRDLHHHFYQRKQFISDVYGINMNVAVQYGASPERVHDGEDSSLWTYTLYSGSGIDEDSTNRPYAGTKSLEWNNCPANTLYYYGYGSDFDLTGYSAITMWVNVDTGWTTDSIGIQGHRSGTGFLGAQVLLEDYIQESNYDVWQKVTIPLSDMSLVGVTIDKIVIRNLVVGATPILYIDEVQIEETGSGDPGIFKIEPDTQTNFYLQRIKFFIVDVYDSLITGGIPQLEYNKILNENSLSSGIILGKYRRNVPIETITIKNMGELLSLPNTKIIDIAYHQSSDTTMLSIEMLFDNPVLLKDEYQESYQIRINDDLSELTKFVTWGSGYYREIEKKAKGCR